MSDFRHLVRSMLLLAMLAPGFSAQAESARHAVFVSDLHVGAGHEPGRGWKPVEDFRWQQDFDLFLDHLSQRTKNQADLILLGDVFELWQSPTMQCSTDLAKPGCIITDCHDGDTEIGCSEQEAVARLSQILSQHRDFVDSIRRFAQRGSNTVHFVPGNHDSALLFPQVQAVLRNKLVGVRAAVMSAGYWLSADGAVYADHGHQFDDVNMFAGWPRPFVTRHGTTFLAKPWGENMVQRFYNQYEAIFPIIDNLSDEKSGVIYAVKQAGFPSSADAVRRFFRFFLFQQSAGQAFTSLGEDGKIQWNYGAVKNQPVDFFVELLAAEPAYRALGALRPRPQDFNPKKLTNAEVDALCSAKDALENVAHCPRISNTLSAAAKGTILSEEQRQTAYLKRVLPKVAAPGNDLASVYVMGHTHSAQAPTTLSLGESRYGTTEVRLVNTGAFQRVASPEQISAILTRPQYKGKSPLDLLPEDLPACYNFVWIAPYGAGAAPAPALLRWAKTAAGGFDAVNGTCLAAP